MADDEPKEEEQQQEEGDQKEAGGEGEAEVSTAGDATVTPIEYARFHKENEKLYQMAETVYNTSGVAGLVEHLAEAKRVFVTADLKADNVATAEALAKKFASALVYSDVLINKLAQRYDGAVKEDETETRKAFADAHAAWAGSLASQYAAFFVTLGRRAKNLPADAPLKALYTRMVAADLIPVM